MEKVYHISRHYLGKEKLFLPKIPVSQNEKENTLPPRICASPTIEKCWEAIKVCEDLFRYMRNSVDVYGYYFFIYEFEAINFEKNTNVFDFDLTNEMISFKPQIGKLTSVFYVNKYILFVPNKQHMMKQ